MNWYLKVLKQYTDFNGRARRKEFWMFSLFHFLIIIFSSFLIFSLSGSLYNDTEPNYILIFIIGIYLLLTIIPSIAVTVRRLHDIGKSGWWYLINLIPYIGGFIIIIFTCMEGENKPNKWGDNPKGIGNDLKINQIGKD
jgi:uncharacterized membrane protein YhaH (DUF805 family)